ncbi:MAG: ergothioneine biosynthesis protein EgtB [Xanthobacteraceae bacterium]
MPSSAVSTRVRPAERTRPAPAEAAVPAPASSRDPRGFWLKRFGDVRAETERRAGFLSPEDQVVQSMPDASPTKWHRAHVTWFFEQFLLKPYVKNYSPFDERFAYLYNSYYVSAGPRAARPQRGLVTRPSAAEVAAYRAHVDAAVATLIETADNLGEIIPIIEIGLHHEQQHQELLLTDILHAFSHNETHPAYDPDWLWPDGNVHDTAVATLSGVDTIGHGGDGFCFDNELPAHQVLLTPVKLAPRLVTNREWLDFMADDGYATPTLWLSDGWAAVEAQGWNAPGYWRQVDGAWFTMTLGGLRRVEPNRPVCHVSYYEADAFARWAGKDLPTEAEWEAAAGRGMLAEAFGVVWQWTRSAYSPYPGYRAAPGALGEYNGKFMVNQIVLRGSSLATPVAHSRVTYRNFFYPSARWQFSGLRLAAYQH